jgi:hypothetical protein
MNKLTCCQTAASATRNIQAKAADGGVHPSSAKRRGFALAKCSLPTLILVLLPKCPACFAAYVALGTGISVSAASVSILRTLLIVLCVTSLVWILRQYLPLDADEPAASR